MEDGDPPESLIKSDSDEDPVNRIRYLALGPGAMGFYALLGSLRDVDLSHVEEISGASAGAILGFFLATGKSVQEILDATLSLKFESLMQPDLVSLINKFGLVSLEPIKKLLVELGGDPKFKDLTKKLHVTAFCVDTGTTEYFSRDTVPDGRVVDFVCMSISVPFLFESVKYKDRVYVDGGLVESVPMAPFLSHKESEVLAIRLLYEANHEPIDSVKSFAVKLIKSSLRCIEYTGVRCIYTSLDVFNFSMSLEDRLRLFFKSSSGEATYD